MNDSIRIKIKEAWLEKQWAYGKTSSDVIEISGYQMIILTAATNFDNYDDTWKIGIDGERYIRRCGNDCLISDFTELPKDAEEWDVQKGWKLDSASKKEIIGKFIIYRKKN